jgi:hypothetical protein
MRKDDREGFRVDGLRQIDCPSAGAAMACMRRALTHRHTRAHALNEYSSRSHCMMSFTLDSQDKAHDSSGGGEAALLGAQGGIRRQVVVGTVIALRSGANVSHAAHWSMWTCVLGNLHAGVGDSYW